MKEVSEVLNKC